MVVVEYMPETELRAGRVMLAELRHGNPPVRAFKIGPSTGASTLDSIARIALGSDRVVIATYVRRIEGEGRFAIPAHIASWIDTLAQHEHVVVVSLGNPYLIRQFPHVGTYLTTYGISDAQERAGARAVVGRAAISGRAPVSLPGFFSRGDGLQREARAGPR